MSDPQPEEPPILQYVAVRNRNIRGTYPRWMVAAAHALPVTPRSLTVIQPGPLERKHARKAANALNTLNGLPLQKL